MRNPETRKVDQRIENRMKRHMASISPDTLGDSRNETGYGNRNEGSATSYRGAKRSVREYTNWGIRQKKLQTNKNNI